MRRNERERIYQKKQKKEEQPKVNTWYTQGKGETKERQTERRTEGRGKLNLKKKWSTIDGPTTVRWWLAETLEGSCVVDDPR